MSNFKFNVPEELSTSLNDQVYQVYAMQDASELPDYSLFNRRLMKGMATPNDELHHAATGIAGEAGEILDITKKVWVYNKPLDIDHLIEELGDLRFYYQSMLELFGFTDRQIIAANMLKLKKRYSTGAYSDAQATARADKAGGKG